MEQKIMLSDLLMMQMVGGLEDFVSLATSGRLPGGYVGKVRETATTPELFGRMVRTTVGAQLGKLNSSLRELGQNARDSYESGDKEKIIEFNVKDQGSRLSVSVRDYGAGMYSPEAFILLLVAYNSGKDLDPEKIGEHGIGFLPTLDISDRVNVTTKKDSGLTTSLQIEKEENDWGVLYDFSDREFKGTKIEMELDPDTLESEIYRSLVRDLGFMDSGFMVLYNGERLNHLPDMYDIIGSAQVSNRGRAEQFRLGFADRGLRYNPFFSRANPPSKLVMTQRGQHVRDPSVSELLEDEVLEDMVRRMLDLGYNFWIDLPGNIGLTKGRNNIVASDAETVSGAADEAFSQGILEKLMEDDELVYNLDMQLADLIGRVLKLEINEKEFTWKSIVSGIRDTYHSLRNTCIDMSFRNFRLNLDVSSRESDTARARKKRYAAAYDYGQTEGFSGELMRKEIIPALAYSDKTYTHIKVSVLDLIEHYRMGTLFASKSRLSCSGKGIYADPSNPIVSNVINHMESQKQSCSEINTLSLDLRKIWAGGMKGLAGCGTAVAHSVYSICRYIFGKTSDDFGNTDRRAFERMAEKHGAGAEYVAFLDNLEYIDKLVSDASSIPYAKIRLFGRSASGMEDLAAETNTVSMGFNVYSGTVMRKYLNSVREGGYNESDMRSLIEIVIHEKAHDVLGLFSTSGDHGKEFYSRAKKQLREDLFDHCRREGIDPYKEINSCLTPVETGELSPMTLKKLL